MGRYAKNRELRSASYSIRMPVGYTSIGPNDPVEGLMRFNNTRKRIEAYYKGKWRPLAAGSGDIEYPHKDTFYGNGTQTNFGPMRYSYPAGNEIYILVFIGNVFQNPGVAYNIDGYEITFTSPPPDGHPIVILHGTMPGEPMELIPEDYSIYTPPSGPLYAVFGNVSTVVEGSPVLFTVNTLNIPNGTVLYYRVMPGTPPASYVDITGGENNAGNLKTGSFTITSNTGSFVVSVASDAVEDSGERFYVDVMENSTSGTVVTTSVEVAVTIYDPLPPPDPIITAFTALPNPVTEGANVVVTCSITDTVSRTIYWKVEANIGASPADFTGPYNGTISTVIGSLSNFTFNVGIATDAIASEGDSFTIDFHANAAFPPGDHFYRSGVITITG